MKKIEIAILGTYKPAFRPHQVLEACLEQVASVHSLSISTQWIATDRLQRYADCGQALSSFDGIWCSPGSPYKSLEGALNGIRYARETNIPFLGTCAGFQHLILEYARNVLGIKKATSAEYEGQTGPHFISTLSCSIKGQRLDIELLRESRARQLWGSETIREEYYCDYGLNPRYLPEILRSKLVISGWDGEREVRIVELPGHPFFMGTLFVPGSEMLFGKNAAIPPLVHPLILAFAKACLGHALEYKFSPRSA